MMPKLARGAAALALVTGVAAGGTALTTPAGAGSSTSYNSSAPLAEVRAATARYHDPAAAVADGFVPTDMCAAHPTLGGMGLHYVHEQRLADPSISATEPEVLLYEEDPGGGVRLVGVEWVAVDEDQDLATDDDRPSVVGMDLEGPMPGHEPGGPVHYDLHAWIWKHNPAGMFAAWNPRVRCEDAAH